MQPRLEPASDFFAAGGDSLSAAVAANSLGISPALVAAHPSARRLARHLAGTAKLTSVTVLLHSMPFGLRR